MNEIEEFKKELLKTEKIEMGHIKSYNMLTDPKRHAFDASKHKFCSKILSDKKRVLDIGCNEALWIPIVAQSVDSVVAIDINNKIIEDNKKRLHMFKNVEFRCIDFLDGIDEKFDGVYSLDVIEHIGKKNENIFFDNIIKCLHKNGICIIGTPNKTAEKYASKISKVFHVNLKTHDELKELMKERFENVLMFGMNDEVIHTGFPPMCNYLIGIGVGVK